MNISFTEQGVFNSPKGLEGFRFYREEIRTEEGIVEKGGLWLPPHINIEKIEEVINNV